MSSEDFLQKVLKNIRSKEAKIAVREELSQHLQQAKSSWLNKGYKEQEAENKAIEEMGSPTLIGKRMNQIHRPKWDFWLIGCLLLLMGLSFIPIVTFDTMNQFGGDLTSYFVEKKLLHLFFAIVLIIFILHWDYRKLHKWSMPIYLLSVTLLIAINYAPNRLIMGELMLAIGSFKIQAWTVLPFLIIVWASFFSTKKYKSWKLLLFFSVPLYLLLNALSLTVAFMYVSVVSILFVFSYYSKKTKLIIFGATIITVVPILIYLANTLSHYQLVRFAAFLNPQNYADTNGYIYLQIEKALAQAGWFGTKDVIVLSEAHTDFALVQLIQSSGYFAGLVVICLLGVVAYRAFFLLYKLPKGFGKMLILGFFVLYSMQVVYSVLMVLGLLPIVGISLPFISYGFTPLLLNGLLMGIVLSVYRRKSYIGLESKQLTQ